MEKRKTGGDQIYGEPTVILTIRVPETKKDEVRGLFYEILERYVRRSQYIDNRKKEKK